MPSQEEALLADVERFATAVRANFSIGVSASPEDQLKPPVQDLLRRVGANLGRELDSRTEATVSGLGARPDVVVVGVGLPLPIGHVELKAPGKGARTENLKGADKKQWEKFQRLPNLIYTDGSEWALYRTGERVRTVVSFPSDITELGDNAVTEKVVVELISLLRDFAFWEPQPPSSMKQLGELLAPICRLIRDDVLAALATPSSNLNALAREWRELLFPDADDAQFADAYAQTLTYALVLARMEGEETITRDSAAQALQQSHGLLAQVLRVLEVDEVREELRLGIDLLERVITAVDPEPLQKNGSDPWLYFYEDFLAAYDQKLRKDRGGYYTPVEVVEAQTWLVSELLRERFDRENAYADPSVTVLDPAAGTGTYPLAAIKHALDFVREAYGDGAVPGAATEAAKNVHAFEILVGPYAVTHLRLSQAIEAAGGHLPEKGVHVYLTDTLESPFREREHQPPLFYGVLAREHQRALEIKRDQPILVCIGNPPYDRQQIDPDSADIEQRKGGWVRFGESGQSDPGILEDFLKPGREAGAGVHLKNLYNDYVYFWRWALWKVFESPSSKGPGIVSFITASSYLRGPGFVGMRQVMRQVFDELWILDLEGDSLGARKTENVFAIRTPVAIAIGLRINTPHPETPATVRYARLEGSRQEKLQQLNDIDGFSKLSWQECLSGWTDPFLPRGEADYWSWPLLTDLFPWQHSGVQFKRTWPIGETTSQLEERWDALLRSGDRAASFRETDARKISRSYKASDGASLKPVAELVSNDPMPAVRPYGWRSLDRQWVIADVRLADRMRPPLWAAHGPRQVHMTSLLSKVLGEGPAAMVCADVPDMDYFSGRGAKDIIPLWLDSAATVPNITQGLLEAIQNLVGSSMSAEDLFAYCYALLSCPDYVRTFWDELSIPGPRVPLTKDLDLLTEAVAIGKRLVWLHTYGTRMAPSGETSSIPHGKCRNVIPVPGTAQSYPTDFSYSSAEQTIRVGEGVFGPVPEGVWEFEVSGFHPVQSWLAERKAHPRGRKSSPLDELRPEAWDASMTRELLELLWVMEDTLSLRDEQKQLLEKILQGPILLDEELPMPAESERAPPAARVEGAQLF